jgi:gliding motility-associated-like protein
MDTITTTVVADPVTAAFTVIDDSVCVGEAVQVSSTSVGAPPLTYLWSFGDGGSATTISAAYTYASKGTYTITLIVNSSTGCADTVSQMVFISEAVEHNTTASLCEGDSINFEGEVLTATGVYSHVFTGTHGCDSTVTLTVVDGTTPIVDFSYINELNKPTVFSNTSVNGKTYRWDFGDSTYSSDKDPAPHQYTQSATYIVCLEAWSEDGCKAEKCKQIKVDIRTVADVPTGFSPNGDGMNDILYVRGSGIREFTFKVFNRWGQKIFESSDLNVGWDGTYKGTRQDNEVIAFLLEGVFVTGETFKKQGNTTVVQ